MTSVYIEINHQCNLHCMHCYNSSFDASDEMDSMTFSLLINQLSEMSAEIRPKHLIISGGEPLLHSQIKEILNNAVELYGDSITLISNGVLLRDFLQEYPGLDQFQLQISMDGYRSDKKIRGEIHFERTCEVVTYLSSTGYKKGQLHMVISQLNMEDIEEFFEFSLAHYFFPTFAFVMSNGAAKSNWDKLKIGIKEKAAINRRLQGLYQHYKEDILKKWPNINIPDANNITLRCPLTEGKILDNLLIKSNGNIQPCHALYDDYFSLGNIHHDTLNKAVTGENKAFLALQQLLKARENMLSVNICNNCFLSEECHGGCPALAFDYYESYLMHDPDCSLKRGKASLETIKRMAKR